MYETPTSYHSLILLVQRTRWVTRRVRWRVTGFACVCIVVFICAGGFSFPHGQAATVAPEDMPEHTGTPDQQSPAKNHTEERVRRAQEALRSLGFYDHTASGVLDAVTETAIRQYQKSKNLPETGTVNDALVGELEAAANIGKMLQRLSVVRQTRTRQTREALLNNPATRDLILNNAASAVANPVRDPTKCYETPTVRCLLAEALENAKAIPHSNMRDWAYSNVLVSQARAGLLESAHNTARHISDPRVIMSALGEIAESQARAGQVDSAIAAAEAVPDIETRLESYASMALILAGRDHVDGTRAVVGKLHQIIQSTGLSVKLASLEARASAALFRIGDDNAARNILAYIQDAAAQSLEPRQYNTALRYVANTLAGAGFTDDAIDILQKIDSTDEHLPVLIRAARAEATDGDPQAAMAMAQSIEAVRYRSLVLVSIAEGQMETGDPEQALVTLGDAATEMTKIELPFARDFARSKIALTCARIARAAGTPASLREEAYRQATLYAADIADNRLAAWSAWQIAFTGNDDTDSVQAMDTALAATDNIHSPSGRVWLLVELAEDRAENGHDSQAWQLFDRALGISVPVTNAWDKSRMLSRLALSMIRLIETGVPGQQNK